MNDLALGAISFSLGSIGALVCLILGPRIGIIDRPGLRSSHSQNTPKGAGIGLLVTFVICGISLDFPFRKMLPASVLSLVSLIGDKTEVSPKIRLVIQIAAAGWVTSQMSFYFNMLPSQSRPDMSFCICLLSTVYIVGAANIYNFMDGINGIAAITGIIVFGFFVIIGTLRGESMVWVQMAAAIAAACAGFLPWNIPRARVFMGDVGSVLLGFLSAVYILAWSHSFADFVMFNLFLFPFFADEILTLVARIRCGNSILTAHRRHIYQIMVNQMNFAHWKISLGYGIVQILVSVLALLVYPFGLKGEGGLAILLFSFAWIFARHIRRFEFPYEKSVSDI